MNKYIIYYTVANIDDLLDCRSFETEADNEESAITAMLEYEMEYVDQDSIEVELL